MPSARFDRQARLAEVGERGQQEIERASLRVARSPTGAIEALYLSWHELNEIYKDIKFLERGFLFDPNDRQLGYIQKAAL